VKVQILSLFLFILGLYFFKPNVSESKAKHLPPPSTMNQTHFGFNLVLSDLLWLDFIQRSFDCSRYENPDNCASRWPYKVLNEASELDPKFLVLYLHGAVHLSVINDDHEGAAALFERAFENINDNWILYYRAAYLNMIELDKQDKAADYLVKAGSLGAPDWTKSLASKIYTKLGRLELSYRTLKDLYEDTEEGPWREELKGRLEKLALQAQEVSKP